MSNRKNNDVGKPKNLMGPKSVSSPVVFRKSVDGKTRQKLFLETPVCLLGHQKLRRDERFSQIKAEVLMNRMYSKRQSHCVLYCLEDNMRFERSKLLGTFPKRNFLRYSSIKHVFLFEDKPDAIMLCIDSGSSEKRTYEAFKFKRKEDLMNVCELIYKASLDPAYVLQDLTPIGELSRISDSSMPTQYQSAAELRQQNCQGQTLSQSIPSYASRMSPNFYDLDDLGEKRFTNSNAALSTLQETLQGRARTPSPSVRYVTVKSQKTSVSHQTLSHNELHDEMCKKLDDEEWEVQITYLQWDNIRGAVINDRGPVYMYVARCLHPV